MLDFQNKALDIDLLKFHVNRDILAYLKKTQFLTKAHSEILKPPLHLWRQNESVGGLGF